MRLSKSYDITVCVNLDGSEIRPMVPHGVRLIQLGIVRQIALWADLKTLVTLLGFFHREKFDLVLSMTPKGGLLAITVAWLSGVPHRPLLLEEVELLRWRAVRDSLTRTSGGQSVHRGTSTFPRWPTFFSIGAHDGD